MNRSTSFRALTGTRGARFATLIAHGLFLVVALWFAVFLLAGDDYPYLGQVNALGFFFGLTSLVAGLWMLAARSWLVGLAAIALGLLILRIGTALNLPASSPPKGSESITLVSASLRTMNPAMDEAAERLLSFGPDVVAVQEANDPAALAAAFRTRSRRTWHVASNGNYMVLSRLPLEKREQQNATLVVRLKLKSGRELVLWNVHAPKSFERPIQNSMFFSKLAEDIGEQKPDIVAGDFNSTPWNEGYRRIRRLLRDGFLEGGFGPGFTFPTAGRRIGALFPFVRIDHIFVGPAVSVSKMSVEAASPGADHYPIIAELAIKHDR